MNNEINMENWISNLKKGDEVLVEKPAYGIASLCKVESVEGVVVTAKNTFHGSGYSHSKEDGFSEVKGGSDRGDFVLKEATPENIAPYLAEWMRASVHEATRPGGPLLALETLQKLHAVLA